MRRARRRSASARRRRRTGRRRTGRRRTGRRRTATRQSAPRGAATVARPPGEPRQLSPLERERITCSLSAWRGEPGRCQWCNAPIESARRRTWCGDVCARAWQRNHIWRFARSAAKRRAKYCCERPGCGAVRRDCEVNHRTARDGKGYGPGCHHHLNHDENGAGGLEVLCRAHHREVTTAQAKIRAAARHAVKAAAANAVSTAAAATDSSSTAR